MITNHKLAHKDKRIHIILDHMFSKDNYTVFMITIRVGKQDIPLWFRCFEGKEGSEAYEVELLKKGVSYVSELFGPDYELIFLADRWFNSTSLMQHIASLGHTFCIRLKGNLKVLVYDKREKHHIWKFTSDLKTAQSYAKWFYDIKLTENEYNVNIALSKKEGVKEPWIIVTNGEPKRAIKDYGYRFGGIECVFKSQKSNGFYLENTVNASLKYFESMYCIACVGILILTMLGIEYSKNSSCYKNVNISTHKSRKDNKKVRNLSLFNTGLTLFQLAFNSSKNIRLPIRFILYDV